MAEDVAEALGRGRNCLVLTQWKAHVQQLDTALRQRGFDTHVGVLASALAKRAPGYTSLGFPDPRKRPAE